MCLQCPTEHHHAALTGSGRATASSGWAEPPPIEVSCRAAAAAVRVQPGVLAGQIAALHWPAGRVLSRAPGPGRWQAGPSIVELSMPRRGRHPTRAWQVATAHLPTERTGRLGRLKLPLPPSDINLNFSFEAVLPGPGRPGRRPSAPSVAGRRSRAECHWQAAFSEPAWATVVHR